MKRLTRVLAVVLTLTMVAAACGSDDDGGAVSYTHLTLPTILLV